MINTSRPDPRVYKLAANKVRLGVESGRAILSSVEDLHPEIKNQKEFDLGIFNWKWEHVHQYRSAFGEIKCEKAETKSPASVNAARNLLVAASLDLMSDLCCAKI